MRVATVSSFKLGEILKQSLKKILNQFRFCDKQIFDFLKKKGYSIDIVSEYSSVSGIPLYVLYYKAWELGEEDAKIQLDRLLDYYDIEDDNESTQN